MTQDTGQLWDDVEIMRLIEANLIEDAYVDVWNVHALMIGIRDSYEAARQQAAATIADLRKVISSMVSGNSRLLDEVASLKAQLAEVWQPLPDGEYADVAVIGGGRILLLLFAAS